MRVPSTMGPASVKCACRFHAPCKAPETVGWHTLAKDVVPGTAQAYQEHMSKGCAVLTVLADDTPLGVAHIARNALAASGAADLSGFLFDLLFPEHNDMANWVFPHTQAKGA